MERRHMRDSAMKPSANDSARPAVAGHAAERLGIDRRRFLLESAGAAGALVLAACDSMGPASAKSLLRFAERKNESLERARPYWHAPQPA